MEGGKTPEAEFCVESVTKAKAGMLASRGVLRSQAQHVRDLLELRLFRPTCCPGIIMVSCFVCGTRQTRGESLTVPFSLLIHRS
jgi:hypothetical protein